VLIYGINPVVEALRAGRVREVRFAEHSGARVMDVVRSADRAGVMVRRVSAADLDREARGGVHQGVVADVIDEQTATLEDLLTGPPGVPLIVVLDGIEDPHNLGAILRTVDAAGASGVVRQTRHAAPLGGATAKASAGAVSHVRIADVVNIARALEELKAAGVWTVGLSDDAETKYHAVDFTLPTALVVGAEGSGLRRLVRERCDWTVAIPMHGHVGSLNVSVATGIALFEALRQRDLAREPGR
jgi:23S rRNA (guanosine2251-2'-O)-methyltransferase